MKTLAAFTSNSFFLLIITLSLVFISTLQCYGEEDLSSFAYSVVKITGKLIKDNETWIIDNKIEVNVNSIKLYESAVEMTGVLYSVPKDRKPLFTPLKLKSIKADKFTIEKYDKLIEMKGKKPRIIEQHPIAGNSRLIDYFDGPLGQTVIYFEDEKEYNTYRSLKELTVVTLEGTLTPAFAYPKGPGKDKGRQFFGFQMNVKKVSLPKD